MTSPKTKLKLVFLVHEGSAQTNLKAVKKAIETGRINAEISSIISDKDELPEFDKISPDYICLAGWKKIIPEELINKYKVLNIHPGLIPDTVDGTVLNPDGTKGLWNKGMYANKAIQNFLDKKVTYAGSSIHFLTINFDFGPVLGRAFEKIIEHDNVDSLYSRLKMKENNLYVEVLEKLTNKLKILIIGAGGGREHALGWKIAQSPRAGKLLFVRGNAGTAQIGMNLDIKETNTDKLIALAQEEKVDLTLVVSDDPLAIGMVDAFQAAKLRVWGATKAASELEWSKAYAKEFMHRHNIPTAMHEVFNDFEKAVVYVKKHNLPIVIKASGLALGKGVTVAQTVEEANDALQKIMVDKIFGNSGNEVVIEEFLEGTEISIHAFSDGKSYKIFPASQDHKRIFDGNAGPNTGGMGSIAPLPFVDNLLMSRIEHEIIRPTIEGMAREGRPFMGILYPGIMLTKDGPKVFEFNARFGDPEAQAYIRLLSTDLLDIIDACIDEKLNDIRIEWRNLFACNIALASGGYPGNYEKGKIISGINKAEKERDVIIFHAGTKEMDGKVVTNGGRVLGVSAVGENLHNTLQKAYRAIEMITFEGMQYRKDIGKKAIELSKQK